jgi:hypothetical protein
VKLHVDFFSLPADGLSLLENVPAVPGGLAGTFDREKLAVQTFVWRQRGPRQWLVAPDLALRHGQAGSVAVSSQAAYVSGLREQAPDSKVFDPVVGTATSGLFVKARAIANGPGSRDFLLELSLEMAALTNLVSLRLGGGSVELPAQEVSRVRGTFALRPDQALLVVLRGPGEALGLPLTAAVFRLDWTD